MKLSLQTTKIKNLLASTTGLLAVGLAVFGAGLFIVNTYFSGTSYAAVNATRYGVGVIVINKDNIFRATYQDKNDDETNNHSLFGQDVGNLNKHVIWFIKDKGGTCTKGGVTHYDRIETTMDDKNPKLITTDSSGGDCKESTEDITINRVGGNSGLFISSDKKTAWTFDGQITFTKSDTVGKKNGETYYLRDGVTNGCSDMIGLDTNGKWFAIPFGSKNDTQPFDDELDNTSDYFGRSEFYADITGNSITLQDCYVITPKVAHDWGTDYAISTNKFSSNYTCSKYAIRNLWEGNNITINGSDCGVDITAGSLKLNGDRMLAYPTMSKTINGDDGYYINAADSPMTWPASLASVAPIQGTPSGSPANQPEPDPCDIFGGSGLRWILCPIFTMAVDFTDGIRSVVSNLLSFDMKLFDHGDQDRAGLYNAWSVFRGFALTLLVIAGLIMVISQVMGFSFLDAYTIKKVLPRILIAIIGITLSWEIMRFIVQFFNDIGQGVHGILTNAFQMGAIDKDSGNAFHDFWTSDGMLEVGKIFTSVGLGTGAAAAILTIKVWGPLALLLLITLGLGMLIGLAVLGIRIAIIAACIVIAPLAIASYILPGTKKLWDFWQNTFTTTLMMYPIVMGFIGIGAGLAYLLSNTNESILLAILVYVAPYFLLPFSFKLAGGLMKTIFSITDDKSKGIFDRAKKLRSDRKEGRKQQLLTGQSRGVGFGRFNTGELARRTQAFRSGYSPFGSDYQGYQRSADQRSVGEVLKNAGSITGNDELNRRVAAGMSEQAYETERSAELTVNKLDGMKAAYRAAHNGRDATGAELAAMEQQAKREAKAQTKIEVGQVKAGYGEFGSNAAMKAATLAKLASASAYNNSYKDADGNDVGEVEKDFNELYGDVGRLVNSGQISAGDGIGLIKGYMQNRPDMKGAAAGVTLNSIEEAAANLKNGKRTVLSDAAQKSLRRSALRNLDSSGAIRTDARAARNMSPVLQEEIKDRYSAMQAAKGTTDEAKATREFKDIMATAANIQDGLSGASEEVRRQWSKVLGQNVGNSSVQQIIETLRPDSEFQQFRREYQNASTAGAAAQAQAAQGQPPVVPPPGTPGAPGTPPPTGP